MITKISLVTSQNDKEALEKETGMLIIAAFKPRRHLRDLLQSLSHLLLGLLPCSRPCKPFTSWKLPIVKMNKTI